MTADENWPEEAALDQPRLRAAYDEEGRDREYADYLIGEALRVKKTLDGVWNPPHHTYWTSRNLSRERVYEAARVTTRIKRHYTQSPLGQSGWSGTGYSKCRYEVQGLVNGRREGFFGDTLAEALERMGEAMELELTKESK